MATLHVVGVIEQPTNGLALNSVYFPTDLPTPNKLRAGLLASQQATLKFVADAFKEYLGKQTDAHLSLVGHADKRGPVSYNQSLSERRAEAAKDLLVAQGVPADHLDTQAQGEQQNLSTDQVEQLVQQNSQLSEEERQTALKKIQTLVFASNRRVPRDKHLLTTILLRRRTIQSWSTATSLARNLPWRLRPQRKRSQTKNVVAVFIAARRKSRCCSPTTFRPCP
jgi:outer membrane protein OmpA-like peptidoglycan-associated protein